MKLRHLLGLVLGAAALSACASHRHRPVVVGSSAPCPEPLPPAPDSGCPEPHLGEPGCQLPPPECPGPVLVSAPAPTVPLPPRQAETEPTPREHPVFDEHPGRGHGVTGTDPHTDHPVFEEHPGRGRGRGHADDRAGPHRAVVEVHGVDDDFQPGEPPREVYGPQPPPEAKKDEAHPGQGHGRAGAEHPTPGSAPGGPAESARGAKKDSGPPAGKGKAEEAAEGETPPAAEEGTATEGEGSPPAEGKARGKGKKKS